jgi:DNA-binding MarR family transcriptional regulator
MDHDQLARALAPFAVLSPTHFPLHFAQVFLVVARKGPCTFQTVMEELDLTNSAVSRTVMALGQTNRKGQPGFDLLAVFRDPAEGRRFLITLTPKGKALARQLQGI